MPPPTDSDTAAVVDPIKGVEARMEAIAAALGEADGVARFNELYLAVTRAVAREAGSEGHEDPAFISRLDVVFADLYFSAVVSGRRARCATTTPRLSLRRYIRCMANTWISAATGARHEANGT